MRHGGESGKHMAQQAEEFTFSDHDFQFLMSMVKERTGIVLTEHKRSMVYSRLARRLRALGLQHFREYCSLLQGKDGQDEIANFVNAMTTNLTHFFRELHHFEHLRDEVLAPLFADPPAKKRLRIWSAGCSSGAEPYSIAMTLHQALEGHQGWDGRILATDIDSNMLETGQRGIYSEEMCQKIPKDYQRYVQSHEAGTMQMTQDVKHLVTFKRLNLMEPWPMQGLFDVIFCRNVVIYFDKETQRTLFARMAELLKPGGWLYIGHSESLWKISDSFELTGRTIYRRLG